MAPAEFRPGCRRLRGYRAVVPAINCLADSNKTGGAREFYLCPVGGWGVCWPSSANLGGLGFGRLDILLPHASLAWPMLPVTVPRPLRITRPGHLILWRGLGL
jgi:hypothetical protein